MSGSTDAPAWEPAAAGPAADEAATSAADADEAYEELELDTDALLADYMQLKQQQQQQQAGGQHSTSGSNPGLQELEAAYNRLRAEAASAAGAGASLAAPDMSPTAIVAAAAEAGMPVHESDIADAAASRYFGGGSGSAKSSASSSSSKGASKQRAGAPASNSGSSGALDALQQQLQQLQQQAQVIVQRQQEGASVSSDPGLQQLLGGIADLQQQVLGVTGAAEPLQLLQQQQQQPLPVVEADVVTAPPAAAAAASQGRSTVLRSTPVAEQAPAAGSNSAAGPGSTGGSGSGSTSSNSSPSAGVDNSSSSSSSGGRRSWGAWKSNSRIKAANVSLLKEPPAAADVSTAAAASRSPSPSSSGGGGVAAAAVPAVTPEAPVTTEDGASIVSRKLGVPRPKKVKRPPEQRQALVQDALRAATSGQQLQQQQQGGAAAGGKQWWQEQFQAVFLPSIRYPDGSVGFVQMDVSLDPEGPRDVRVLSFEDRHDCMTCLTVLRQWPAMASAQLSMGAMPSQQVEEEIKEAYARQLADAGGDAAALGLSPPAGVVVFRRGKLPMRVGMSQDEFSQAVVMQAAAQLALANMGYRFDDEN